MENLTLKTFKEKVFDFETNSEFTFIGNKPAIIDFYAEWCRPCKTIAPILEELRKEYPEIDFYKVDIEDEPDITAEFNIRNIPAVLFIPMTGKPQMTLGALPKNKLKDVIKETFNL